MIPFRSCFNNSFFNRALSSSIDAGVAASKRVIKIHKTAKKCSALDPLLKPDTDSINEYFYYLDSMIRCVTDQAKDTQIQLIKKFEPEIAYKIMLDSLSLEHVKAVEYESGYSSYVKKFFATPEVIEYCESHGIVSSERKMLEVDLIKRFGPEIANGLVRDALTFESVKGLADDPNYAAKVSKFFKHPKVKEYYTHLDDDYRILYD